MQIVEIPCLRKEDYSRNHIETTMVHLVSIFSSWIAIVDNCRNLIEEEL